MDCRSDSSVFKIFFRAPCCFQHFYHMLQSLAFVVMAIIIMRLKLFGTPALCVMASLLASRQVKHLKHRSSLSFGQIEMQLNVSLEMPHLIVQSWPKMLRRFRKSTRSQHEVPPRLPPCNVVMLLCLCTVQMISVAINKQCLGKEGRGLTKIRNDSTSKLMTTGYRYPGHKCTL